MEYIEEMLYLYNFTLFFINLPFFFAAVKEMMFLSYDFSVLRHTQEFRLLHHILYGTMHEAVRKVWTTCAFGGAIFFSLSLTLHISRSINNQLYTKVNGNVFTRTE